MSQIETARAIVRRAATIQGRVRDRRNPPKAAGDSGLIVAIHEAAHFRDRMYVSGWAFHPEHRVVRVEYRLPGRSSRTLPGWAQPSEDAANLHGPAAARCGFRSGLWVADAESAARLALIFTLGDGRRLYVDEIAALVMRDDPYHALTARFFRSLTDIGEGSVLEIGSRNRSGNVRRQLVPPHMTYVGFDVVEGGNVDVVGDAHELSTAFPPETFDAVFSMSTFEHLAMPWKVAIEINRVIKPGGLVLTTTHQTWPLHEVPWDYWRFSRYSWSTMFNAATGFEVVDAAMGEPAAIVPHVIHQVVAGLSDAEAHLGSAAICRKVGPSRVAWDVSLADIVDTSYPM